MSFKWKTILGVAAIELFFLSFLIWQAGRFIQELGEAEIEKRADYAVTLAKTVLLDSLISYDLATIDEQIQQLGGLEGVIYVALEGHGKMLASSALYPSTTPDPDESVSVATDGSYDIVHSFDVGGQSLGLLRIGFSLQDLFELTFLAKSRLYAIAFLELLLVGVCSLLLARYLVNRVLLLQRASAKIQSGELVEAIPSRGQDEISATIRAFNQMASALAEREQALKDTNLRLRKANQDLSDRESEMWSLFNAAPDGIAVLDGEARISFANAQLIKMLGTGKAPVIGRPLHDFITVLEGDSLNHLADVRDDDARPRRSKVVNFAGKSLFVETGTSVFQTTEARRSIVIFRNKTHEQKLKLAATRQEQLKANLVDASLDALVTIDGHGLMIDYSRSAEAIFGWTKSEMLGQPMENYLVPSHLRSAHQTGMAHFLATGEGPLIGKRTETLACRKDGSSFPVELALHASWFNEEVLVTASIRDITERKWKEEELLRAKEEADEASMAKSRFLSYMSHEIRSPMNAVLGALALIRERGTLEASDQFYLDLARESGDALLQVVNDILDFSKIEAGHVQFRPAPCGLADLVRGVQAAILAKGVKPEVRIAAAIDSSVPPLIMTDGERLRQILTILLDNAYKFTEKGEVLVSVAEVHPAQGEPARLLRIAVKDTGPGVPSDLVETIFSEFEQIDATRDSGFGGTGLGLAIAKRLAAGLDGRIWIESEIGTGSTFTLEIPFDSVSEDIVEAVQSVPPNVADPEQRITDPPGLRVLLVDDVEANLVIGAELLKTRGYTVDVARNGVEAVERAEHTVYSVILMDIRMPVLNGLEATEQIRSQGTNRTTPIIALTANAEKSEIDRCLKVGMDDFVSKPFNVEHLNKAIEKLLSGPKREERDMQKQIDSLEEPEVLSEEVLDQLAKDTSAESLPMMISVFINEIKKRLEGIERAYAATDESDIREQSHALKSCAGTFGGQGLQAAANELEELASRSAACSDGDAIIKVRQVAEQTLVAYSSYRDRLQVAAKTVE